MDKKPETKSQTKIAKPKKLSIIGKFIKDAGRFVFDENSKADDVKKDLLSLEMTRAQERAAEKEALAKAAAKAKADQAAVAAKAKSDQAKSHLAEIAAKQKAEAEAKAKFNQAKNKTAEHFKKERTELLAHKQAVAEYLLKSKHEAKPLKTKHSFFSFFKKHPKASVIKTPQPVAPILPKEKATKPKSHGFSLFQSHQPKVKPAETKTETTMEAKESSLKNISPLPVSGSSAPVKTVVETSHPLGFDVKQLTPNTPSEPESHKEKAAKKFQEERLKHETVDQKEQIENRTWNPFNIVAANLIKDQRSMFLNWQGKMLFLSLFLALSALACVLVYGFLLVWEQDKLKSNSYIFENLDSINAEITKEETRTKTILAFNDKLLTVDYLLKNHIYWTNFFKFLEDNTIKDVYYESFSGDTSGKYILPAVAKDFRSVSLQLSVLQAAANQVLSVDSNGAATNQAVPTGTDNATSTPADSKVKFNLNLNINRSVFIKDPSYEQ